jgi:hypothetical protein
MLPITISDFACQSTAGSASPAPGAEIERLKRAVDEYCNRRYIEADTPSGRVSVSPDPGATGAPLNFKNSTRKGCLHTLKRKTSLSH